MKIGVFDSGVGGEAVAKKIKKALPEHEIILREDKEHVPYGSREPNEILGFITPIFQSMIDDGCKIIVVACNTVTTTLINEIREKFAIPFVAIEPMVKPASALTITGVITICATPATLKSERYKLLKNEFTQGITVIEPDCSKWARLIETNQIDQNSISEMVNDSIRQNSDVIVLACTHYQWIESDIKEIAGDKAQVIEPSAATIEQLKKVISQLQ